VGDRVVALPDHKAWAELVTVPATSVFALPPGMSYLDAAAITMNYTVAYILLFELAHLTPGKSLLLHSAGGGVVRRRIFLSHLYFYHGCKEERRKRGEREEERSAESLSLSQDTGEGCDELYFLITLSAQSYP